MARKSITLSPKHGVNPSVTHCECCGKSIGIAMLGQLKGDAEAPRDIAMGFCEDCQKVIDADGLMIIEVRNGESGPNPYRTGRIVGISKEAKNRIFKDLNQTVAYMEEEMFQKLFSNVEFNKQEENE